MAFGPWVLDLVVEIRNRFKLVFRVVDLGSVDPGVVTLEMVMGTRNPNTRWVLPDMKGVRDVLFTAGMLMGKNLHPLGRRVWVGTTHSRVPMGKIYLHHTTITI